MTHQFHADDRVLVLQPASYSAPQLREWAHALTNGILVGLGELGAIRLARRELADCENVLFVGGSRDEIPWRNAFFTVIVDAEGEVETPEMRRVLHPSGRIYSIQP
jgi:hypothetical protein